MLSVPGKLVLLISALLRSKKSFKSSPRSTVLCVDELESRLAPATLVNPSTVTYQDVDGDNVTVKISRPLFTDATTADKVLTFATGAVNGSNAVKQQLTDVLLHLLGPAAQGISLSITARRDVTDGGNGMNGGDGRVNVGQIDATGLFSFDLGAVLVDGDLGRIQAGNLDPATTALASLTVRSLGRFGTSTGSPDLQSDISGRLGTLRVKADIVGAAVNVTGGVNGTIGTIFVSGSLLGGAADSTGRIYSTGAMGAVLIQGDVVGGAGSLSGRVRCDAKITGGFINGKFVGVTVGGSLSGGSGKSSGSVWGAGGLGPVKISGNVEGGAELFSGSVQSGGRIARMTVGGSIIGGSGDFSGVVDCASLDSVKITGNLEGGAGKNSGRIRALDLHAIVVGGSIHSGSADFSGCIAADSVLGAVKVFGSLIGTSAHPVVISAYGPSPLPAGATTDVAIKSVNVRGRVEFAQVLAGYASNLFPFHADVQVGSITVGGDWIASSVAAGVVDGGNGFGNSLDVKITDPVESPIIASRIGSIVINGQVLGTVGPGDHFGFVAEQIGSFTVAGEAILLTPSINKVQVGATGDVTIWEI